MRSYMLGACLFGLALPLSAGAEELSPENVARIQREQDAAIQKVNAAHGDKKSSEMDTDERRQVIREQAKAQNEVLDKHGVSTKDLARYEATMSLEDRKRATDEAKRLDAAAAADAKKKATPPAVTPPAPDAQPPGAVVIQRGTPEAKEAAAKQQDKDKDAKKHKRRRR